MSSPPTLSSVGTIVIPAGKQYVVLQRHFEGVHNTGGMTSPDPELTEKGIQLAQLAPRAYPSLWPNLVKYGCNVWSSPLTRALQTAIYTLPGLDKLKKHLRIMPDL